jgi:hypothetical protein
VDRPCSDDASENRVGRAAAKARGRGGVG